MKRFLSLWLAGLLLAPLAAHPAPAGAAILPPSASDAQRFTLANGMTLLVKPDRRAPTVVHMLWVKVGSMDEVDGTSGVAHVLEHMLFKGTAKLGPGEFSQRMAALGARDNAFTSRDATAYHQQAPADQLDAVMALEADRFANNRWPDEEFEREIEVVKEERRSRVEESPRARMFELFNATAFVANPYRRPVIGWMNDIESMTPEDARAFYRQWYVPANAAVVVVGDVDVQAVLALAQKHYGGIAARPVPARKPRVEPPQHGLRLVQYQARTEQAVVALGWKVPHLRDAAAEDGAHRDALALTVLAAVLDGYSGARLDRALVQGLDASGGRGPRLADSASATYGLLGRGPQLFMLSGIPAPGVTTEQLTDALKAAVARVAREGIAPAELRRVKTQWTASEIYKLDSIVNQARELGTYWINDMPPDTPARLMARLRAVTAEQVQDVARRYFVDSQLTQGVLMPEGQP